MASSISGAIYLSDSRYQEIIYINSERHIFEVSRPVDMSSESGDSLESSNEEYVECWRSRSLLPIPFNASNNGNVSSCEC